MRAKDHTGLQGEEIAAGHLRARGHEVLERRWRCPRGELDLITRHGDTLVAVEVKTRRGLDYGHPFEAVTPEKLRRLHRLIGDYAAAAGLLRVPRRVDVVAVVMRPGRAPEVEHLRWQ